MPLTTPTTRQGRCSLKQPKSDANLLGDACTEDAAPLVDERPLLVVPEILPYGVVRGPAVKLYLVERDRRRYLWCSCFDCGRLLPACVLAQRARRAAAHLNAKQPLAVRSLHGERTPRWLHKSGGRRPLQAAVYEMHGVHAQVTTSQPFGGSSRLPGDHLEAQGK